MHVSSQRACNSGTESFDHKAYIEMVVTTYSLQQIKLILMLFLDTNLRFGAECKVLLADFRDHKASRKINKPVGCSL